MSLESMRSPTDTKRPTTGALADAMVPPAMLVVAVACGVASYLHFGFAAEFAAAIALALFCIMLLCHVLLRADEIGEPANGATDAAVSSPLADAPHRPRRVLEATKAQPGGAPPRSQLDSAPPRQPKSPVVFAKAPAPAPARSQPGQSVSTPMPQAPVKPLPPASPPALASLSMSPRGGQRSAATAAEPAIPTTTAMPPTLPPVPSDTRPRDAAPRPPNQPQWAYQPVDLKLPIRVRGDTRPADHFLALGAVRQPADRAVASPSPITPDARPSPPEPRLTEQQRVEQILKRLAAQIRAGVESATAPAPGVAMPEHAAPMAPAPTAPLAVAPSEPMVGVDAIEVDVETDTALAHAVDTLRSTVEAMRGEMRGAPPPARAPTAAEVRLAAVAEALAAERSNVYLQPILALNEDSASHFEVSVRLRLRDGQTLDREQIAHDVRGAGLLPLLDAIGVRQSANFALKLERRGRDGTVFSQIAGESLESTHFVSEVAGRQSQGVADRLILAFDQEEIRGLGVAQMAALSALKRLGFRFAIERLSHLDMDFETLRSAGFAFVKLDAEIFGTGLAIGGMLVPADELCLYFREHGLDVIVGRITDEAVRDRLIDHGVMFGQGSLFGEPRPIPVSTLETGDSVAA